LDIFGGGLRGRRGAIGVLEEPVGFAVMVSNLVVFFWLEKEKGRREVLGIAYLLARFG
jgi:hypothetical protein